MTASDARPPSDDREALAAALREIGPKPGGVMEPDRIAQKLLDHEWFRETVERKGREAMSQHPEPARPPSDTTRPATADDVITEVERRLRSFSHPEDARSIALLHIEAYREGRARARLADQEQP